MIVTVAMSLPPAFPVAIPAPSLAVFPEIVLSMIVSVTLPHAPMPPPPPAQLVPHPKVWAGALFWMMSMSECARRRAG